MNKTGNEYTEVYFVSKIYISYFSNAVGNHHSQGNLQRDRFI